MTEWKESQTTSYGVIKTALQILGSGAERDVFYRSVNTPHAEGKDGTEFKWEPVANLEAKAYIECAAKKWRDEFGKRGLVDGDVVAVWYVHFTYIRDCCSNPSGYEGNWKKIRRSGQHILNHGSWIRPTVVLLRVSEDRHCLGFVRPKQQPGYPL